MGVLSLGVSAKLVMRFGIKPPLAAGLLLASAGSLLFARAPVHGHYVVDVLPSMMLLGFGAGIAFNPVLLAAMSDVAPERVGSRLGHRQHRVHDGRRARPGGAREPRGIAHGDADRRGREPHRRAHRRVPHGVPGRRAVRDRRRRHRRALLRAAPQPAHAHHGEGSGAVESPTPAGVA